jgi:hypothetical protein
MARSWSIRNSSAHFATTARYQAFVAEYLRPRGSLPRDLLRLDESLED